MSRSRRIRAALAAALLAAYPCASSAGNGSAYDAALQAMIDAAGDERWPATGRVAQRAPAARDER